MHDSPRLKQALKGGTIILTGRMGSRTYGTSTPESDYDFTSVVIPSDAYLGLSTWGQSGTMTIVEESEEYGVYEHKLFDLKKFLSLASAFNPNVVELLWIDPSLYSYMTEDGKRLIENRELFVSKRAFHTLCGYARGQLKRMGGVFFDDAAEHRRLQNGLHQVKLDIETAILRHNYKRSGGDELTPQEKGHLAALRVVHPMVKDHIDKISIGGVTGRMGKKRKDLREKHGYDVKFAMHTIRLLRMAEEFLTDPGRGLNVNRVGIDADELLAIRSGAWTDTAVKELADQLFRRIDSAFSKTSLSAEPDEAAIEALAIDILKRHIP
jgi:hypothetical protein